MGKTAVFVISILNQIVPPVEGEAYDTHQAIITCHTRELAHQIYKDFKRLGRYFKKPELRYGCYFGGVPMEENEAEFKDPNKAPHIIIATPGRLYDLAHRKLIVFEKVKIDWFSANSSLSMNVTRCSATPRCEQTFKIFLWKPLITSRLWCSVLLCLRRWRRTARSFCRRSLRSSLMKVSSFSTAWPNSMSTSTRYKTINSEQKVRKADPSSWYLGLQSNDHFCQQSWPC